MITEKICNALYGNIRTLGISDQNQRGLDQAIDHSSRQLTELGLKMPQYLDPVMSALILGACMTFSDPELQKTALIGLLSRPNFTQDIVLQNAPTRSHEEVVKPHKDIDCVAKYNASFATNPDSPYYPGVLYINLVGGRFTNKTKIDQKIALCTVHVTALEPDKFAETTNSSGYYKNRSIFLPSGFRKEVLLHELVHSIGRTTIPYLGADHPNMFCINEFVTQGLSEHQITKKRCKDIEKLSLYDWIRAAFAQNLPSLQIDKLIQHYLADNTHACNSPDNTIFARELINSFQERNLARTFQVCRLYKPRGNYIPGITIPVNEWGKGKIYW